MNKMKNELKIENLHVEIDGKEIVKGVSLTVKEGEVVALMGPNGSGKSTLSNALMGNPSCKITKGSVFLNGKNITDLSPDKKARLGIFLSFQYPSEISGVTVSNFLRSAYKAVKEKDLTFTEFKKMMQEKMDLLDIDSNFVERYINEGFSGGEKKKNEILQMSVLEPKIAILDETDSGLDFSALKIIARGVNVVREKAKTGILIITHYKRILDYIVPDKVYVMCKGKIVKEGGKELVGKIEEAGYDFLTKKKIVIR